MVLHNIYDTLKDMATRILPLEFKFKLQACNRKMLDVATQFFFDGGYMQVTKMMQFERKFAKKESNIKLAEDTMFSMKKGTDFLHTYTYQVLSKETVQQTINKSIF